MNNTMKTVLVVDDERELRELVSLYLKKEAYHVLCAADGNHALQMLASSSVDLVILDVMMDGLDGFSVCETIRKTHVLPVIMLTARSHEEDKIKALKLGADDYVVKPFSPKELLARVEAVLRRSYDVPRMADTIVAGELLIDRGGREVYIAGDVVRLTRREYELLLFLAEHRGQAFSREQLFRQVWDECRDHSTLRTVDTHIKTLRLKLGEAGRFVQTVWGIGYKFEGAR
ncbi:response regulator transcription factor [Shouchella lonarensis]|uniref:Two-component system, OmpR family, response regulator n=1 Tax=Shouchella lonarensis TaxID=1464122 RepID=A0A1G6PBX8_9BACI|nr:response regulator transcription factor [Shouchella lonarensis]SDC77569.1 two-component system, OmpR family, response regulator [Shouchella lonarensis]